MCVCIYRDTAYTSLNDGQTGRTCKKKTEGRIKMVRHFLFLSLSFNDRTTITLARTREKERLQIIASTFFFIYSVYTRVQTKTTDRYMSFVSTRIYSYIERERTTSIPTAIRYFKDISQ